MMVNYTDKRSKLRIIALLIILGLLKNKLTDCCYFKPY